MRRCLNLCLEGMIFDNILFTYGLFGLCLASLALDLDQKIIFEKAAAEIEIQLRNETLFGSTSSHFNRKKISS